ncbi:unnamed protein product [Nezara viridula]|uniref:C2H2-type domain-containing protein n=1 Tax=Nezara viridula TaxID=85310 RepID=A0A9P0H2F8_NEZVI|nr:unnamed protein product [Nezara viridula]
MSEEKEKLNNDKLPFEADLSLSNSPIELAHNSSIIRQENEGILRQALLNSPEKEFKLGEDKMLPLIIDLCDNEARKHKSCDVEAIQLTYASGGDSSEYTAQLLSQLTSSALPTISCSQVSSVLSALEPNSILSQVVTNNHQVKGKCKDTEKANEASTQEILTCRMEKRNYNKKSWYYCPSCELVCLDEEKANYHAENCTGIAKRIYCLACDNTFNSTATLQVHLIIDHKVAMTELKEVISINLETIKNKSNDNTGIINLIPQLPLELSSNSKREKPEKITKKALKKITNVKVEKEMGLRCGIEGCAVRLVSPSNMSYHRQCHDGVKWKCLECCENSSSWANLSLHLWKQHSIDMELYSCDQCSYKTNSLSKLLNLHRRTHGNERPFLCDSCGKGFKTTKQLRNHKTVHKVKQNGENENISCSICGRAFTCMRMLRHHTDIVHRKLRPYLCSDCGHSAASRSSLRMHSRQHTGEKPYRCNECEYRTSDHNTLRRHKMRHTGAKHYTCPHCPYACIQSSTFKSHLKNKHPGLDDGLMFSCEVCPFRTVKKDNFLAHISYHSLKTPDNFQELSKDSDLDLQEYNLRMPQNILERVDDLTFKNSKDTC